MIISHSKKRKMKFNERIKYFTGKYPKIYSEEFSGHIRAEESFKVTIAKENSLKCILTEHVFEHLDKDEIIIALKNCYKYLSVGGRIRIAVPDGYFPDKNYIDNVKTGVDGHKVLLNIDSLTKILTESGYKVIPLEYWDKNGKFHFMKWNKKLGYISRSMKNDSRNSADNLVYTSLIIDGIKGKNRK